MKEPEGETPVPRDLKKFTAAGPLPHVSSPGTEGSPALDPGLRLLHLKQQPRDPALGDWLEWRLCVIVAAVLHDWRNTCAPRPRAKQPWALVQRVTLGQSFPPIRVTASTNENFKKMNLMTFKGLSLRSQVLILGYQGLMRQGWWSREPAEGAPSSRETGFGPWVGLGGSGSAG